MGTTIYWHLAQPVQDLLDQDKRYGEFMNLGTIGNRSHLQKHGGHTPWRAGSARGIVWAKDTHCPKNFRAWLIKKCKSSSYNTSWIRFWNCDGSQYDNAGNRLGSSGDYHFHCEVADGHQNTRVTLFTDYIREVHGGAPAPPKEAEMSAASERMIGEIWAMLLDGKTPAGKSETINKGEDRIAIFRKMEEVRDELKASVVAAVAGLKPALSEADRAAMVQQILAGLKGAGQ